MNAYLLTWNPKYYDPHREIAIVRQSGYCISNWSSRTKKIEEGDQIYLMRQGVEPRGIVAHGEARKQSEYVYDGGRWYAPLCWYYFKETPIILIEHLNDLFPEQHWSPRQSGISIKPEVIEEGFIQMIEKAIKEQTNESHT